MDEDKDRNGDRNDGDRDRDNDGDVVEQQADGDMMMGHQESRGFFHFFRVDFVF
jgi:hypothetical protein